jgi:hypothetical protein
MSYDIYFLKRDPGQSWEDAMEALEEQAAAPEVLTRPPCWDQVVSGVRYILGDVSVLENPPAWAIDHERTGIQVSCFSREWSITVPYWSDGDAAVAITGHLRAIAGIVQRGPPPGSKPTIRRWRWPSPPMSGQRNRPHRSSTR